MGPKLYAGIDVGSLTAEGVLLRDGELLASARLRALPNPMDSARQIIDHLLRQSGCRQPDIAFTVSTGYGREEIQKAGLSQANISEISCHGFGALAAAPAARTVIDIGGQDAKVIRVDERGDLVDFAMNDKCAAGTGHFLELMSRALGLDLEQLGPTALGSRNPIDLSNRCSIFIETEVIHFLQRGCTPADLAAGVCRAMAERVVALVRRVDSLPELAMTGGVAKNVAVRRELEKRLDCRLLELAIDPQLVGAYGAALLARRRSVNP